MILKLTMLRSGAVGHLSELGSVIEFFMFKTDGHMWSELVSRPK